MEKKNLNLGCGNKPLDGFINIDFYNKNFADDIVNLNNPLPYPEESIDLIYSDNVFEHIENLIDLVKECYRILRKEGTLIIKCPYFKSKHAFVDPTHKHFFTIQSMNYFVKNTYFNKEYKFFKHAFSNIEIFLDPQRKSFLKKMLVLYSKTRPNYFENSLWSNIFVFNNIVYVLIK